MNGREIRWALAALAAGAVLTAVSCTDAATAGNREKAVATFAGGCFWCMEPPFEKLDGVLHVEAGYTGGERRNPTYKEVASGHTRHAEAVRIRYDPTVIDYATLLDVFWRQIDPTDPGGQFADRGMQYRTAIFYHDDEQRRIAEASKAALGRTGPFKKPIVTAIVAAGDFWIAEDYHQDYYKKNAAHYKAYRRGSGREGFLERTWAAERNATAKPARYVKPDDATLREKLTPLQYAVTQQDSTERAFQNEYWDNKRDGIYVDIVTGEPLFSSKDKFKSGTGWPSFTKPLVGQNVVELRDNTLGMVRTEVRSKHGDSHLGHLFPDGPQPTGLRYCINSASLRFVPVEELEAAGLEEFVPLFRSETAKN